MAKDKVQTSRRRFLQTTGIGVGGSLLAQHQVWAAQQGVKNLSDYKPEFFSPEEWKFIMAACDRLIPQDGNGPGALACHVPIYIDKQMLGDFGSGARWYTKGPFDPNAIPQKGYQSPFPPKEIYQRAIKEINAWCQDKYSKAFAALDVDAQDSVLTALDKGEVQLPSFNGKLFFDFLLQNTKEGYFSDPQYGGNYGMQSWVFIGFPGARGAFLEWAQEAQHNKKYPLGPVDVAGDRA